MTGEGGTGNGQAHVVVDGVNGTAVKDIVTKRVMGVPLWVLFLVVSGGAGTAPELLLGGGATAEQVEEAVAGAVTPIVERLDAVEQDIDAIERDLLVRDSELEAERVAINALKGMVTQLSETIAELVTELRVIQSTRFSSRDGMDLEARVLEEIRAMWREVRSLRGGDEGE
jgi:hypothetical protein